MEMQGKSLEPEDRRRLKMEAVGGRGEKPAAGHRGLVRVGPYLALAGPGAGLD